MSSLALRATTTICRPAPQVKETEKVESLFFFGPFLKALFSTNTVVVVFLALIVKEETK